MTDHLAARAETARRDRYLGELAPARPAEPALQVVFPSTLILAFCDASRLSVPFSLVRPPVSPGIFPPALLPVLLATLHPLPIVGEVHSAQQPPW